MISHLTRLLGPAHIDLAEESVQTAMLRALQLWPQNGIPENPPGWLFLTAKNIAIDAIRRNRVLNDKTEAILADLVQSRSPDRDDAALESQLRDDEMRMIIMCCHPALARDARVALSLKTVSGFSVREIARAFLAEEPTIAQRLVRAKRQIREDRLTLEMPSGIDLHARLDSVLEVLYFMFNEGYAAHEGEALIRKDLCFEALRLALLIASSSVSEPRANALVALLAFQAARFPARVGETGDLILLDHQDRSLWDRKLIQLGFQHFELCMRGETVSSYHMQAAIAATHARSVVSGSTDWETILLLYDKLLSLEPTPVVELNRAVAICKVQGPKEALSVVDQLASVPAMRNYYLFLAVRGQLLMCLDRYDEAAGCFRSALEQASSEPERRFLRLKMAECQEATIRS